MKFFFNQIDYNMSSHIHYFCEGMFMLHQIHMELAKYFRLLGQSLCLFF